MIDREKPAAGEQVELVAADLAAEEHRDRDPEPQEEGGRKQRAFPRGRLLPKESRFARHAVRG